LHGRIIFAVLTGRRAFFSFPQKAIHFFQTFK
jgi:hypothetical protein